MRIYAARTWMLTGFVLLACGPIFGGGCVEQTLKIESNPPGALVYLNGDEWGRTPVTKDFDWYGKYDVAVRMDGYETLKTGSWLKAPWWNWVPMDFFATILPFHFRDDQHLFYTLTPTPSQAIDPLALIERASDLRSQLQSSPYTRTTTTTHPSTRTTAPVNPVPATAPSR